MSENNPRGSGFRLVLLAILVGSLSAVGGISLWKVMQGPQQISTPTLMVLPEPRTLNDFLLIDDDAQPFSLDNLRGHWTLMFFGFTNCPDVCPSALYDLNLVTENLRALDDEVLPDLQVVFVSVDPERDTPEKLSQYLGYFNADFVGVTGEPAQLTPMTRQIGIAFEIEDHEPGAETYHVYHSASFILTDPNGRLYGVFGAPHDAEKITRSLLETFN